MTIKTNGATDATQIDLNQARESRDISNASPLESTTTGSRGTDSIALSGIRDLVQQALSSGADARTARIAQLKQQIDSNQYQVDPVAVSRALINAHLAQH